MLAAMTAEDLFNGIFTASLVVIPITLIDQGKHERRPKAAMSFARHRRK